MYIHAHHCIFLMCIVNNTFLIYFSIIFLMLLHFLQCLYVHIYVLDGNSRSGGGGGGGAVVVVVVEFYFN